MSTIAYASITNARAAAPPNQSSTTKPGMGMYVDAMAALVPAEVLTLHGLIMSYATKSVEKVASVASAASAASAAVPVAPASSVTASIPPDVLPMLKLAFWLLVVSAGVIYIVSKKFSGKLDKWDWVRTLIAPIAFIGWTMLQPTTAFDAAFPQVPAFNRAVIALFIALFLTIITTGLAKKADAA